MTRIRAFQLLVVASVGFYLAWILLPLTLKSISPEVQDLLAWNNYGSVFLLTHLTEYLIVAMKLVASFGLFLFLSWGRWLFLGVLVLDLALVPFSGVAILLPLNGLVGYLGALIDGAIVALAFSSPIAEGMRKDA